MKITRFIKKVSAIAVVSMGLVSTVFASAQSGLYTGSASTVKDEDYYLMNVLDWSKLDFKKAYIYTNIDDINTVGNAAVSFKNKDKVLGFAWKGNLWNETNQRNYFDAFLGMGKMGFGLSYGYENDADSICGKNFTDFTNLFGAASGFSLPNLKVHTIVGSFGMNFSEKDALAVYLTDDFTNYKEEVYGSKVKVDLNVFNINACFYHRLFGDNKTYGKLGVVGNGNFAKASTNVDCSASINSILLGCTFDYQKTFSEKCIYAMNASAMAGFGGTKFETPIINGSSDDKLSLKFTLNNGVVYNVAKKLDLSAGIATTIPTLVLDDDTPNGSDFGNTVYGGFAFHFNDNVKLCGSTSVAVEDGYSLDEGWQQVLNFTLSIKF